MIAQKGKTLPYDIATHPPEARPLGTPATNPTLAQGVRTGRGLKELRHARLQSQPRLLASCGIS